MLNKSILFSFVRSVLLCFLLSSCDSVREVPNYVAGSGVHPHDAVGVFRVIFAKHDQSEFLNLIMSHEVGGIVYIKGPGNNVISMKTNGNLDNADSAEIYVKRLPPGLYKIEKVEWKKQQGIVIGLLACALGNYNYNEKSSTIQELDTTFEAKKGMAFYIGDIILDPRASGVLLINNYRAVLRKLKQKYPELVDQLEPLEVTKIPKSEPMKRAK